MASDDRKRRILNHLSKSIDGVSYTTEKPTSRTASEPLSSSQPVTPEPSPLPPPPKMDNPQERKRKVMNHVKLSSDSFGDFSMTPQNSPQKIQEHLRKSLN